MAARMRNPSGGYAPAYNDDLMGEQFDPTAPLDLPEYQPQPQQGTAVDRGTYKPPSGNTGVSGLMGSYSAPPLQPSNEPKPEPQQPEFNGDYLGYIQSLLRGTTADRNVVDDIEDELAKVGITNQRASDGTSRGRVHLPNGQYVDLVHGSGWGDTWANLQARDPYVPQAGGGVQMSQSSLPPAQQTDPELWNKLKSLFDSGGDFNQDIVNRRSENAATALRKHANSRKANNNAYLAERGLIGSGPEASAQNRVEEDIANQYADAVSGIYADESSAADQRMMQAISLAAGLSTADADRLLGYFRANNDFTLGQGDLALRNSVASNNYNLGLGDFGLRREELQHKINTVPTDQLIELLKLYLGGAQTSAGGYY